MLSRVAERLYWLGRYIERAENTARLVMVNNNLLLDLPGSASALWESLLALAVGCGSVLAMVWAGARVFRVGVLMQGKTPTPRELLRWIRAR